MNYKYEIINYDNNIPAKVMLLDLLARSHKTELHWHREPELVYVIDGEAECMHNGDTIIVEKGGMIFFNSEDVHLVRPVKNSSARILFVQISLDYMRLFCKNIDNVAFDLNKKTEAKSKLADVLKLFNEIDEKGDEYEALLEISYVNKIYYILFTDCLYYKRASSNMIIPKRDFSYAKIAISYINENSRREITLNEISSVVNLSPSYFSKYFKNVTQVSFSEYLVNLRLENAMQDMIRKNSTVSTAAIENGFANVKSFITQCKKVYGQTPAQYKNKLLNR